MDHLKLHSYWKLGGGFKYFCFSPLFGENFQFDEHIFQMGWFNHQPEKSMDFPLPMLLFRRVTGNDLPKSEISGCCGLFPSRLSSTQLCQSLEPWLRAAKRGKKHVACHSSCVWVSWKWKADFFWKWGICDFTILGDLANCILAWKNDLGCIEVSGS